MQRLSEIHHQFHMVHSLRYSTSSHGDLHDGVAAILHWMANYPWRIVPIDCWCYTCVSSRIRLQATSEGFAAIGKAPWEHSRGTNHNALRKIKLLGNSI